MDRETYSRLHSIATDALSSNETMMGEIRAGLANLRTTVQNSADVDVPIMNWHKKSGQTEAESVNKLCDMLEKEMAGQMDWFNELDDIILKWSEDLHSTPEYQQYEKTKNSETDLMPLLRKCSLSTIRRLLEEFSQKDFDQMFGSLKE